MDLVSLVSELQLRGLDQGKVDSGLRLLIHVSVVQDSTSSDVGGVLVQDVLSTYPLEVVQAASELFLEKLNPSGLEVYRVKWGYEDAARNMARQIWENSSGRWTEFVANLDERYVGFLLPQSYENARVVQLWKLRKDLKWFSVQMPSHGWRLLGLIDDIAEVAWKLDLAFGFRPYGPGGIEGERTLIHKKAFDSLKEKAETPPEPARNGIKLWKFFTEFDPQGSNFVALMNQCGLTLEDVTSQIEVFAEEGLTSRYRDGQYPPFLVAEKMKKEFPTRVKRLLEPMDSWLSRTDVLRLPVIRGSGVEDNHSVATVA